MVHPCRVQVNHRLFTPNTLKRVAKPSNHKYLGKAGSDNLIYQVWGD